MMYRNRFLRDKLSKVHEKQKIDDKTDRVFVP